MSHRSIFAAVLLVASAAHAQLVFSDGFESSTLLKPTGSWDRLDQAGLVDLSYSTSLVHGGAQSLLVTDGASGQGHALLSARYAIGASRTVTLSFWFNTGSGANNQFAPVASIVNGEDGTLIALLQYGLGSGPTQTLYLSCGSDALTSPSVGTQMMEVDRWYSVDLTARDIGIASAECAVAIDGVPEASIGLLNSATQSPDEIGLGQLAGGATGFTGTYSFDDVSVRIGERDSGFAPIDAGSPPVDAGSPPVDAGSSPVDAGSSPVDAGPAEVDAGALADAGSQPDGGAVMADSPLGVGCDCAATPLEVSLGAMLLFAAARRRRQIPSNRPRTTARAPV